MPAQRDSEGKIIDIKTEGPYPGGPHGPGPTDKPASADSPTDVYDRPTEFNPRPGDNDRYPPSGGGSGYDAETEVIGQGGRDKPTKIYHGGAVDPAGKTARESAVVRSDDSPTDPYNRPTVVAGQDGHDKRTRIWRGGAVDPAGKIAAESAVGRSADIPTDPYNRRTVPVDPVHPVPRPPATGNMADPPVGWLVVIAGPGQGASLILGNGVNAIGRDASQRLPLDFGDELISRVNHAQITYDPRGKKFYIQHGGGANLTYVNDEPVLAPRALTANTHIMLGATTLRFVPLCGEAFDWDRAG